MREEVCMGEREIWLRFSASMARIVLEFVEKRKARRANDEPDS